MRHRGPPADDTNPTQEQNGAGRDFKTTRETISQESRELCFGHLAPSHDKVWMKGFAVPPFTLCMASRKSPLGTN